MGTVQFSSHSGHCPQKHHNIVWHQSSHIWNCLAQFGTCFSCLHWLVTTCYDSPPGKQVPRNLGICSGRTPYERRDMERLNGAKAVSTQDLETWRLGQPMSTENHCFPCAVEVWAHGSTATRTLSDLKLCLSCFFPPCSVGFLGSQM